MSTGRSVQKTFFTFRSDDFPLYVFSLVVTGAVIFPAVEHTVPRLLVAGALLYLACMFVIKHGCRLGIEAFRVLFTGILQYPSRVVRSWWSVRSRVFQAIVVFALAVGIERLLYSMLRGTFLLKPFPWRLAVWLPFAAITAFRATILFAHLLRASHVRQFLQGSPIKSCLEGASIYNHIVLAAITGALAHLCMVAPCVLFYMYTSPSYLREALLIVGYVLWCVVAGRARAFTAVELGGDGPPVRRGAYARLFAENHSLDHRSRFYFTVFHGHHHDVIPTAMIGAAGGTGPLESADRVITWLEFLDSIIVTQVNWILMCVGDMLAHQYVPGVFPYSRFNLMMKNHHAAHHFGSLYPLGPFDLMNVTAVDIEGGYDPDNARIRWYLDGVQRYEGLTEVRRQKFVSRHFAGHARVRLSTVAERDPVTETQSIQQCLDTAIYDTPSQDRLRALEELWMRAASRCRHEPNDAAASAWEALTLWRYARELDDFSSMRLIKEAHKKLKAAIAADPEVLQGVAHLALGMAYAKAPGLRSRKRARAYLERSLSLAPDALDRNVAYGEFLLAGKDQREVARKILERALNAPPLEQRMTADRVLRARAAKLLQSLGRSTKVSAEGRRAQLT